MTTPEGLAAFGEMLLSKGLSFDQLRREATAIALFGSRAYGCARADSDWDVLCVGSGRSRRLAGIDLVWVPPHAMTDPTWLGGDLPGHVATYGVWLHGESSLTSCALPLDAAAKRKAARIARKLVSVSRVWHLLGPAYRRRDAELVRREAQRLDGLRGGVAVPPTALLDAAWDGSDESRAWLCEQLTHLGSAVGLAHEIADLASCGRPPTRIPGHAPRIASVSQQFA
jgi:hypothetical protein